MGKRKLRSMDVLAIRLWMEAGYTGRAVAAAYGITHAHVYNLRNRVKRKGVDDEGREAGPRLVRGERHHYTKLRAADVRTIRARLAEGEAGAALAREYGVTPQHVSQIRHGYTWKELTAALPSRRWKGTRARQRAAVRNAKETRRLKEEA
jgi:transposase